MRKQKFCAICNSPLPENAPLAKKTCSVKCKRKQDYKSYKKCIANKKAGTPLVRQQLDMYKFMSEQLSAWKLHAGEKLAHTSGILFSKQDIEEIVKYTEIIIRALGKSKMPMPKELDPARKAKNEMLFCLAKLLLEYTPIAFGEGV